jgi:hypothetical protein
VKITFWKGTSLKNMNAWQDVSTKHFPQITKANDFSQLIGRGVVKIYFVAHHLFKKDLLH